MSKLYIIISSYYDDGARRLASRDKDEAVAWAKAHEAKGSGNWSEIAEIDTETLEIREVRFWDEKQA